MLGFWRKPKKVSSTRKLWDGEEAFVDWKDTIFYRKVFIWSDPGLSV